MPLTDQEKKYWIDAVFNKEEEEIEAEINQLDTLKQEEVNSFLYSLFLSKNNEETIDINDK
jgi:hypothetical protein